ncbi:MAG: AraC family transcriptional regulator [Spirochaetaceae bacterium]|nr:AraC family transcriptional regulator [Spirochaetaceae bacterium]
MTIYEQIQRALDYIEDGLFGPLRERDAAREAGMSVRSFNRWFWAVTGRSYREYVVKRRLREATRLLFSSEARVLDVALAVGYGTHESFSRAFKCEFGISPLQFRRGRCGPRGEARLDMVKEMYMGVVIRDLPEMLAVAFEGFAPEPESEAGAKLAAWQKEHPARGKPRRVFGHNIDLQGNLDHNPKNVGYKFLATIESLEEAAGERTEVIRAGRFAVTGIEGSFETDPTGRWIAEGWERMNSMIREKLFTAKACPRWFEEELEPEKPGNLRLDLYLELSG